ncbi:MAG: alanine--tRNA ligase [Clostridia bacterium]
MLTSNELRKKYLDYFKDKNHAVIPSASVIPVNDATVLFTTAGMHPLVPFLLGQKHPQGNRLCDVQKCIRTGDIDEVGDNTHCTFFEMMGNWSLGDYFKEDSISYSFEFLTKVLGLDINKIAVSVFAGDSDCSRDEISANMWRKLGIKEENIFYLPKENNWWIAGTTGPCGPDTEIFIDTGKPKCCNECSPACDCGKYIEIWNNVFMEFNKTKEGVYEKLQKKNVDTGMGLERTLCTLNGYKSVYDTDVFADIIKLIENLSGKSYLSNPETTKAMRIIADHIRTATFIIGDKNGVTPSNVDQGYVLRRLLRRAIRFARLIDLEAVNLVKIADAFIAQYQDVYEDIKQNREKILDEIAKEEEKFTKALANGLKELEKVIKYAQGKILNGKTAFRLYDTFGFPIEMTVEIAKEQGFDVDEKGYQEAYENHQKTSQLGAEQKFKGGLADTTDDTTHLHTATHLMLSALKKVVSSDIQQKGSNITTERLRFDFNLERPCTKEELAQVEAMVNDIISQKIPIVCEEMSLEKAKASGATGVFENKYLDVVKVYTIGNFSKEICGGPHAVNTGDLGKFVIVKEQSCASGVRRIKAVLQK